MAREKELYRPYIERLDEIFPQREIINQKECAALFGCCTKTVRQKYKIRSSGISKLALAKLLAGMGVT